MSNFRESRALWSHRFGVSASHDPLVRAVNGIVSFVDAPQLTGVRHTENQILPDILIPPLAEQARRFAKGCSDSHNDLVAHSQGAWVLAQAVASGQIEISRGKFSSVTLLAPALSSPAEWLSQGTRSPTTDENDWASSYGGAYNAIRLGSGMGSIVLSRAYWAEVAAPGFNPLAETANLINACLKEDMRVRVVKAGQDAQLGEQVDEYDFLRRTYAEENVSLRVVASAGHVFRGYHTAIATGLFWHAPMGESLY